MPQLQPFYYTQELGSIIAALILLTLFISIYFMPSITSLYSIRRYLTSL